MSPTAGWTLFAAGSALLLPFVASAGQDALPPITPYAPVAPTAGSLTTTAAARGTVPNTRFVAVAGVEARSPDEAAAARADERARALVAYLRAAGANDPRTQTMSLTPEREDVDAKWREENARRAALNQPSLVPYISEKPGKIVGYTGRVEVSFTGALDAAPTLVEGVLANGADSVRQVAASPETTSADAIRRDLLAQATTAAMADARAMAQAAGQRVAGVEKVSAESRYQHGRPPPLPETATSPRMAHPAASAQGGEDEIGVWVTVTVRLAPLAASGS